jgi:dCMP deaminase
MRPSWDQYFLKLAMLASERATCPRMHCGCVIVRDKHVLATGYNGSLPGLPHCDEVGCMVVDGHCIRTNHAEMNAICQAARNGVSLNGGSAYVTNMPCTTCAKALVSTGIRRVIIFSDYHSGHSEQFLHEADVRLDRVEMPEKTIIYDLDQYPSAKKFRSKPS